jgi:hypothetical protein
VNLILSTLPELATQVSRPGLLYGLDRLPDARHSLERRGAETVVGDDLHLLDEVFRKLAAASSASTISTQDFSDRPIRRRIVLLDDQSRPWRLERRGKARVGQRLAVDQHAVAIEND